MTGKEKSGKQEGIEKVATEGEGRRWEIGRAHV